MKLAKFRAAARPMALTIPHWIIVVAMTLLSAVGGAVGNYLLAVPMATWTASLTNPKSLVPILVGAAVAGGGALLGQLVILFKQWASTIEALPDAPAEVKPPPSEQT